LLPAPGSPVAADQQKNHECNEEEGRGCGSEDEEEEEEEGAAAMRNSSNIYMHFSQTRKIIIKII